MLGERLIITADRRNIHASRWASADQACDERPPTVRDGAAHAALLQLKAYAERELDVFRLPLIWEGTDLMREIWQIVVTIPFGERISYGEVAHAAGRPGAHRAVARAMGLSNFAFFMPAHRVVGADGKVKGGEPGSLRARLLEFEAAR